MLETFYHTDIAVLERGVLAHKDNGHTVVQSLNSGGELLPLAQKVGISV